MKLVAKIKTKLILATVALSNLFVYRSVFAQDSGGSTSNPQFPTASMQSFSVGSYLKAEGQVQHFHVAEFIVTAINYLALIVGSVSFLCIVIGGIMLVTSAGVEHQQTRGKEIIKYAIIGLLVTFISYYLVALTKSVFYEVQK